MKKLVTVFMFLVLVGCAPTYTWKTQNGKTDVDRDRDYEQCIQEAGLIYGFWNLTFVGLINNDSKKYKKEEKCLREKGWIE